MTLLDALLKLPKGTGGEKKKAFAETSPPASPALPAAAVAGQAGARTTVARCGSPHCDGCYSIGMIDGDKKFLHPPKVGPTTEIDPIPRRQIEIPCWHCAASGRCGCIVCLEVNKPGPCAVCHGTGRTKQWVA